MGDDELRTQVFTDLRTWAKVTSVNSADSGTLLKRVPTLASLECVKDESLGPSDHARREALTTVLTKASLRLKDPNDRKAASAILWLERRFATMGVERRQQAACRNYPTGKGGEALSCEAWRRKRREWGSENREDQLLHRVSAELILCEEEARRLSHIRSCLDRHLSSEISSDLWRYGCKPLLDSGLDSHNIVRDLDYRIRLKRQPETSGPAAYAVRTILEVTRPLKLSPEGTAWVTFVRTSEAWVEEYANEGCMLRELVEWPKLEWQRLREKFSSRLRVREPYDSGKVVFDGKGALVEHREDLARFEFKRVLPTPDVVRLRLVSEFMVPASIGAFPVLFLRYVCRGKTRIEFEIDDDVQVHSYPNFEDREIDRVSDQSVRILTPPHCLLRPGAGVVFTWSAG